MVKKTKYNLPDKKGHFGIFGGRFVPETLMKALEELEKEYLRAKGDKKFQNELSYYLKEYAGRPTPLYLAKRLSDYLKTGKIYLKREDLLHTGAHKINNTLGQILLAKRMKKKRIIAETGAGQHGVATATASSIFGLECEVYMGEEDIERQSLNVFRMKLLGAKVTPVKSGSRTLKDAINEALRDWVANVENTHYIIGSVVGPHPYPMMVRDFQAVIGKETKKQIYAKEGRLPTHCVACVGGGSNSIGLFYPFIDDKVELIGVEAGGYGLKSGKHGASLEAGEVGVFHGSKCYILQDDDGQIKEAHSVSAGLDYPGVGPEHSYLKEIKRVKYVSVKDDEALEGFKLLSELEGIIPALETSHAIAYIYKNKKKFNRNSLVVLGLSGRGDKDVMHVQKMLGKKNVVPSPLPLPRGARGV